jgi:hypothetical protein
MGCCESFIVSEKHVSVNISSSELNNLTENNNNDLHSYWTINQLNKIDVDINDDPNIINVIKAFGI